MRVLLNNPVSKAISLVLAVVLWLVITGEQTSEIGLRVPIEIRNMPKDLELTGELSYSVEVRLRATAGVIHRLALPEVSVILDLSDAREGERIVHLTEANVRVPFGVKVANVKPSLMRLQVERIQERSVSVRPRLVGKPAVGYELDEILAEPAEVRIVGPRSRVLDAPNAFTEPVSVEGARESVVETVNLGLEDAMVRITGNPRVKVTARIRELREQRVFDDLAVTSHGVNAVLAPRRVRVVLEGPASLVRAVTAEQIQVFVELRGLLGTRGTLPVAAEISPGVPGVSVLRVEPETVTVRIAKQGG